MHRPVETCVHNTGEGSDCIWKQVQPHAYTQVFVTAKIEWYEIKRDLMAVCDYVKSMS